jgi:hypothetical protein
MASEQDFGITYRSKGKGKAHPRTGHKGPEVGVEV